MKKSYKHHSITKKPKIPSDYRKSLLLVTNWFIKNKSQYVNDSKFNLSFQIFLTLSEIQEILYLPDNHRNITNILRLINITFTHAMFIKLLINGKQKSLTSRKLFGKYYHSLIRHSSEQYRIFSGRSANTEKEEATFSILKKFTNNTSNHHPDNILSNAIIRIQAREILKSNNEEISNKDSVIHHIYKPIKQTLSNNIISFQWIKDYSSEYQCILEKQSDYLCEKGVWWCETDAGIQFNDYIPPEGSHLKLSHFRSTSIKDTLNQVRACWNYCIKNRNELIPAYKIKIYDEKDEKYEISFLSTLNHFKDFPIEVNDTNKSTNKNSLEKLNAYYMDTTVPTQIECKISENSEEPSLSPTLNISSISSSTLEKTNTSQEHIPFFN